MPGDYPYLLGPGYPLKEMPLTVSSLRRGTAPFAE